MNTLRATPYEANRTLALLSKMFSLAERWGMRPDGSNPASNIDRYRERRRERFLTPDEIARLADVLDGEERHATTPWTTVAAIRLLLMTGRRLNEVLNLEWSHLDFPAATMRLPDTKTGALTVHLSEPVIVLLRRLRAAAPHDAKYVIPGRRPGARLVNLQKPWRRIRSKAGLEDVRLHDLRHTYASIGAGLGLSLPMIGKLLGHTQVATTARYAHLAADPIREAANAIGRQIERTLLKVANDGR